MGPATMVKSSGIEFETIAPLRARLRRHPTESIPPLATIRNPRGRRNNRGFTPMDIENPWVLRAFCGMFDQRYNPMEARDLLLLLALECHCRDQCSCLVPARRLGAATGRTPAILRADLGRLVEQGWIFVREFGDRIGIVLLDRADHLFPYANTQAKLEAAVSALVELSSRTAPALAGKEEIRSGT